MGLPYYEERHIADTPTANLGADIAKHLQARQHLGKTIIICEKPQNLMPSVRKQWLKFARQLQRERSSTVSAEKILRLTNAITHMHHMRFSIKSPVAEPKSHVYFMTPDSLELLPTNIYNVYVTAPLAPAGVETLFTQLPNDALLVDYTGSVNNRFGNLKPKAALQESLRTAWVKVEEFLQDNGVSTSQLISPHNSRSEVDDALDTLLGINHHFLSIASDFQHTLELAQPLTLNIDEQRKYDLVILLAHRVQALSPSSSTYRFTTLLNDESDFFLHDIAVETAMPAADGIAQAIQRHREAGRTHLARALAFTQQPTLLAH